MNNLFISYDLHTPGQNYEAIADAIKSLGSWAKIHYSLYYVSTSLTAEQACQRVQASCDSNDKALVIGANAVSWNFLSEEVAKYIADRWDK